MTFAPFAADKDETPSAPHGESMPEATIRDVARRAQLSVATVSRALNGFDNVSEQARERVAEAVRELGYVPHAGARSLSLARTNAIGVVLPDLHGEFFSEIVRGMDREASRRGYLLLLSNLHAGSRAGDAGACGRCAAASTDLIVMAPHLAAEELAAALPPGFPSILINTRDAAAHAAGDPPRQCRRRARGRRPSGRARPQAARPHRRPRREYRRARSARRHFAMPARSAGVDLRDRARRFRGGIGRGGDRRSCSSAGTSSTRVFAANDNMAIGALQALRARGLARARRRRGRRLRRHPARAPSRADDRPGAHRRAWRARAGAAVGVDGEERRRRATSSTRPSSSSATTDRAGELQVMELGRRELLKGSSLLFASSGAPGSACHAASQLSAKPLPAFYEDIESGPSAGSGTR